MKPTTLITGGAKRIGAALAEHLAAAGHDLVLHYRASADEARALSTTLTAKHGTKVTLVQADLAKTESLATFWDGLPPVTAIIHNASHYVRDKLEDFTPANLRTHLAVNIEAPLLLTQGFMAQLPAGVTGNVIVLSDGVKRWSVSPEFFTYAATRQSWDALIDLLASACAPRARANAVALAPTLEGPTDPEGLFDRLAERTPLKRNSNPAEVCAAVDYLLGAAGVTGQTLSLAAGMGLATVRF